MKIKRFNESDQLDISSERVEEILKMCSEWSSSMTDKSKGVESLLNELQNFKSQSQKGNDQIDDSIAALQVIQKDLSDCSDKIDTVITNLKSYNDEGRKYLYTENK